MSKMNKFNRYQKEEKKIRNLFPCKNKFKKQNNNRKINLILFYKKIKHKSKYNLYIICLTIINNKIKLVIDKLLNKYRIIRNIVGCVFHQHKNQYNNTKEYIVASNALEIMKRK